MEYQKVINLLDDQSNQPSKFRTKHWVEINDNGNGIYDRKNLDFKMTMLNEILCESQYLDYLISPSFEGVISYFYYNLKMKMAD